MNRRAASARVASLVEALSDDLIGDEDRCKEQMDAVFADGVSGVFDAVEGHWRRGNPLGGPEAVAEVEELAREAVAGAAGCFRELCVAAVRKGLESARTELQVCEATLAARYAGVSDRAVTAVANSAEDLHALGDVMFATQSSRCLSWFRAEVSRELAGSETLEEAIDRLVAPDPVQWPGHSGRGLWWQVVLWLNQITRETEFAVVNAARTEAMRVMNEIGDEIDAAGV